MTRSSHPLGVYTVVTLVSLPQLSSFLEVFQTSLFVPVGTEMMVTSVLLGGDGPTIPCSLVALFRRSLSHPSSLVAALTEVTMS